MRRRWVPHRGEAGRRGGPSWERVCVRREPSLAHLVSTVLCVLIVLALVCLQRR